MDEKRIARVAEAIREELAEIIGFEMSDPRVRGLELSGVVVSHDGEHATVRLALSGDGREQKAALAALEGAAGFLRHELAARLDLRRVPALSFTADKHPDADERVEILLKRAGRSRGAA